MGTTTVKTMQHAPSHQQEVKVFFKPRFGIKAQGSELSVDVRARQEKDKEKDQKHRG